MTEEQIEAVGWFSDELLAHPHFRTIVDEFEKSAAHEFLNTRPSDDAERVRIYYTYNGAKQFLDFMRNLVKSKNDICQQRAILDDEAAGFGPDAHYEEPINDDGYQL